MGMFSAEPGFTGAFWDCFLEEVLVWEDRRKWNFTLFFIFFSLFDYFSPWMITNGLGWRELCGFPLGHTHVQGLWWSQTWRTRGTGSRKVLVVFVIIGVGFILIGVVFYHYWGGFLSLLGFSPLFFSSQIPTVKVPKAVCKLRLCQRGQGHTNPHGNSRKWAGHRKYPKNSLKAPETSQNKTKWPHFQQDLWGEIHSCVEEAAQEGIPALAALHHPSQIHPSGPAGGDSTNFCGLEGAQRVWVELTWLSTALAKGQQCKAEGKKNQSKRNKEQSAHFQCINSTHLWDGL